jgi:D-hydroxyproline dehydrogenase subunit alpha
VTNFSEKTFDVAVIGAGPAGMAAAVCAAQSGARVALIDDNPAPGGQIWRSGAKQAAYGDAAHWIEALSSSGVVVFAGARLFHVEQFAPGSEQSLQLGSSNGLAVTSPARMFHVEQFALDVETANDAFRIRCNKMVLGTGARELFLPFPGWTLPNVMGVGGLQALAKSGLPLQGKRIVVAGTGPLLLAAAAYFSDHDAKVLCICEQAPLNRLSRFTLTLLAFPEKLREAAKLRYRSRSSPYWLSAWPVAAIGTDRLRAVQISVRGHIREMQCDYLACGFHLVPNLEIAKILRCRLIDGFVAVNEYQETSESGVFCAGEPTGIAGVELSLIEGQIAGYAAAGRSNEARKLFAKRARYQKLVPAMRNAFALRPELANLAQPDTLLCRCEDVPVETARKHGGWRSAKLHSRCGMGPCQGRVCGAATEFLFGWSIDSWRPPIFPVRCSTLAAVSAPTSQSQIGGVQ